ncbi:MAG: DUF262 domain-containing protein [Candidatus Hodarchaeota archaeon]
MAVTRVRDDTEQETIPFRYAITSYGADYPVDSLIARLEKDVVFVPFFQRKFVWTLKQASRFIESLLLGLPVPGVFLARDEPSAKLFIIDGQQRLRSLQYFYNGVFLGKEFALRGVQERYEGKTYKSLEQEDLIRLNDSIIHATIVRQDEPSDDQSSVYHIFERLNTGGTLLHPQEIRACIFHGPFNEFLSELNDIEAWRNVYGLPNKRLKDQELILRFLALKFSKESYSRPMKEFLNKFMGSNRYLKHISQDKLKKAFVPTIELINSVFANRAFRPERALNAAVFDSVMVGLSRRLARGKIKKPNSFKKAYEKLLGDADYMASVKTSTSDETILQRRIQKATSAFSEVI